MPIARDLLAILVQRQGSDLHLSCGSPPVLRVHGRVQPLDSPPLAAPDMDLVFAEVLSPEKRARFAEQRDLDFVYEAPGVGRFRGNAFLQHRGPSVVFRVIPDRIPTVDELGLPQVISDLARLQDGMVLITGPAGVGKSTTLAALIDLINRTRHDHVITIEDPIEFVHSNNRALVNQREVGLHTHSFAAALRAALREDPDVILVGELRDPETTAIALTAAETGHLVLGTLHTGSSYKTIDRIIDSFPGEQQGQVRSMLSESLRAVVAQKLLRRSDGKGRVVAYEVLINTPAISSLVREGKTFQIPGAIQMGRKVGMVLMDQSIADLVAAGLVDPAEAALHVSK
jgi:twitching motility protein PilT